MKILFVCEGNMMRSQMAELFYNSLTKTTNAISAGAIAEMKDHISPRAIEAMADVGLDAAALRPTQVTESMLETVDKVIYFPSDCMPEYVISSSKSELWDVADPHYNKEKGMPFVFDVRDDIQHRVSTIINN